MVRAWDFLTHGQAVQEVGGLNPGCGFKVGFQATDKVFFPEYAIYCK